MNHMEEQEQENKVSKRDQYLSRMRERYPDVDFDDEESRYEAYGKHEDDMQTKLGQYEESDGKLKGLFKKDPRFAGFMTDVVGGGDTSSSFVRHFGKDMLEMSGDEVKMAEMTEANQAYLNRVAESDQLRAEQEKNMEEAAQAMSDFKAAKGLDDAGFEAFIEKVYGVIEEALMGRISGDFLETMYKGLNYETDLEDAAAAGVVEGRNQQIDERLKKTEGDGIPSLHSGGKGGSQRKAMPKKRDFYEGM